MRRVRLPCSLSEDLDWTALLQGVGEDILWEFDLGLDAPYFSLDDPLRFHALKLALSYFSREVWPSFQEKTVGGCLYRGSADFSITFDWSEPQQENWEEWKKNRPSAPEPHLRRLFCADAFAHYFQMLSHALPDELALYLFLDGTGCGTKAEVFQLFSKERFEHFLVVGKGIGGGWSGLIWEGDEGKFLHQDCAAAICFPEESQCSGKILEELELLFHRISEPCRVIHELFLTESWERVDRLYVLSDTLSTLGKRKLIGFCAAGGTVIVEGKAIGLSQEIQMEEFRGRGI